MLNMLKPPPPPYGDKKGGGRGGGVGPPNWGAGQAPQLGDRGAEAPRRVFGGLPPPEGPLIRGLTGPGTPSF